MHVQLNPITNDTIVFLRALARNNNRDWFTDRKVMFQQKVQAPFFSLIDEVNSALQQFAPEHVKPATKIALRIYRDTRFSADKRPYKQHMAAWWGRSGMVKTSGAGFYLHLSGKELLLAAGLFMPTPEQMAAERSFLAEYGDEVQRVLADRKLRRLLPEEETESMKRVPRGFDAASPWAGLLRQRRWGVSVKLPAHDALKPGFVKDLQQRFRAAAPLVEVLNRSLVGRERRRLQELF